MDNGKGHGGKRARRWSLVTPFAVFGAAVCRLSRGERPCVAKPLVVRLLRGWMKSLCFSCRYAVFCYIFAMGGKVLANGLLT